MKENQTFLVSYVSLQIYQIVFSPKHSRNVFTPDEIVVRFSFSFEQREWNVSSGNIKGGSITIPLTSCLTCWDWPVLQIKTKIASCHTADSKAVKQEVKCTVILPPVVFPGFMRITSDCKTHIILSSVPHFQFLSSLCGNMSLSITRISIMTNSITLVLMLSVVAPISAQRFVL